MLGVMPDPIQWTAALVLAGLRMAFAREPEFGQSPAAYRFILERARTVLGERSPEFAAVTLRAAPAGVSLRELCREHYGWRHSRSELYRRSRNGAVRVAASLNESGIAVPPALLPAG